MRIVFWDISFERTPVISETLSQFASNSALEGNMTPMKENGEYNNDYHGFAYKKFV